MCNIKQFIKFGRQFFSSRAQNSNTFRQKKITQSIDARLSVRMRSADQADQGYREYAKFMYDLLKKEIVQLCDFLLCSQRTNK